MTRKKWIVTIAAVAVGLLAIGGAAAAELRAVANSRDVPGTVATRARIVLWTAEGWMLKDIGDLAGESLPTVDRWKIDRRSMVSPAWRSASAALRGSRCRRGGAGRLRRWSIRA